MKRLSIILAALISILLLAALIVPALIPTSVYRAQIEAAATEALGREVTLDGDPRLSILPRISARIEGARIANPDGFSSPYMIEAGTLSGTVKLLPLLARRIEIGQITLSDAQIRLERLENGEDNWTFAPETDQQDDARDGKDSGGFETGVDKARLRNTSVFYIDRTTGTQYALEDFNATAQLKALDSPLSSKGNGVLNGQNFDYDITLDTIASLTGGAASMLDVSLKTDFGRIIYEGRLSLEGAPALDGRFEVRSNTVGELVQFLAADLPIRGSELQSIEAKGSISGLLPTPRLEFDILKIGATGLDFSFDGLLDLGTLPSVNGSVGLELDNPKRLLKDDMAGLAAIQLLETVRLSGDVSGPVDALSLENIDLKQSSDLLSVNFEGDLSLAETGQSQGRLDARSDDLRGLLNALGVQLAPGDTLRSFDLKGEVTGSRRAVRLEDTTLRLDDVNGTGSIGADLGTVRPKITANMALEALDLSPFLGSEAKTETAPTNNADWNDDPLALDGLNAIDADMVFNVGSVKIGTIELADALLSTKLEAGRLTAEFNQDDQKPGFRAFDGDWSGSFQLDAGRAVPSLGLQAKADGVATQKMLSAVAGYGGLAGIGGLDIDLESRGNSLKALVNGLEGSVSSQLANGSFKGVNLAQMVRSAGNLQTAMQNGTLSVASFREAISPEAETDFSNLLSGLTFNRGVATIQTLQLDNPVVAVSGSGTIDLGARTLNIRLVPAIDTKAQGQGSSLRIDDIPIPVRISGAWTTPSFGIDTGFVQAELTRRLAGQVEDRLRDELGGALGRAFGSTPESDTTNADNAEAADDEATQDSDGPADEDERSLEDRLVDEALGSIFGQD